MAAINSNHGLTGNLQGLSLGMNMTLSGFCAVAFANSLEVFVRAWFGFKKHEGFYFWSINVSAIGNICYIFGLILKFYDLVEYQLIGVAIIVVFWMFMVTGQSLVLYSRLHLIVPDPRRYRWTLWMICCNGFCLHTVTAILIFGSNSSGSSQYVLGYSVMEKIQVTGFFLQELTISCIYIYQTRKLLTPPDAHRPSQLSRVLRHLIYVNVLVILMDVALISTEFANLYEIQVCLKGAVYAVKLRFEFAILNQLIRSLRKSSNYWQDGFGVHGTPGTSSERPAALRTHDPAPDTQGSISSFGRVPSVHPEKSILEREMDEPAQVEDAVAPTKAETYFESIEPSNVTPHADTSTEFRTCIRSQDENAGPPDGESNPSSTIEVARPSSQ